MVCAGTSLTVEPLLPKNFSSSHWSAMMRHLSIQHFVVYPSFGLVANSSLLKEFKFRFSWKYSLSFALVSSHVSSLLEIMSIFSLSPFPPNILRSFRYIESLTRVCTAMQSSKFCNQSLHTLARLVCCPSWLLRSSSLMHCLSV